MSRQSFIASLIGLPRPVSVQQIVRDVASAYGVSVSDVLSKKRTRDVVIPRQEAMRRAMRAGVPILEICRTFERDYTTVYSGIKRAEARQGEGVLV